MNYRIIMSAVILGLAGITIAFADGMAINEEDSDDRVACIEEAISEEVEEGKTYDDFVESCYQEKIAQRQVPAK